MKKRSHLAIACSVFSLIGCGGGDKEYAGTWDSGCRSISSATNDGSASDYFSEQIFYVVKKVSDGNFSFVKTEKYFATESCSGKPANTKINNSKRNTIAFAGIGVVDGVTVDKVNITLDNGGIDEVTKDILDVNLGRLYFGDKISPLDSTGYPTKLDRVFYNKMLLLGPGPDNPDTPQEGEGPVE